jgi:1,4-dihydroxy-2-naphthoyl-CoA hydrolase
MLRTEITAEHFHEKQRDALPGRFGLVVTRIEEGRLDAEVALQPWMMAPNGYLHAASVLLLADTTAGYASLAHLPEGAKNFTTIELKSNFLGTVREGTIRAECRAEHLGRTTHVWSATVFGPADRKLALFRCTQMVLW